MDASLERIARDAGVPIGTLYRHFPTRLDLLLAALDPRLREFAAGSKKALEIDDPWDGFVSYLENLFRVQAGDRGFNDFLSRRFPGSAMIVSYRLPARLPSTPSFGIRRSAPTG